MQDAKTELRDAVAPDRDLDILTELVRDNHGLRSDNMLLSGLIIGLTIAIWCLLSERV